MLMEIKIKTNNIQKFAYTSFHKLFDANQHEVDMLQLLLFFFVCREKRHRSHQTILFFCFIQLLEPKSLNS
jgi:hypothetical protein